jgi:hypothetical protein
MIPTQKIEYIGGNDKNGIKINWDLVRKEYKKLKIPKIYHNPLQADFSKFGYIMDMSDRSRGKTTNKLIVGLILYKLYGIKLHYLSKNESDCFPKEIKDLYDTVKECNYIAKIFGDGWTGIDYYGKRWTLTKNDADGKILESDNDWCTICFGCDESDKLKSRYNCPRGDMIFYDEFIRTTYGYNDFIWFTDLCKTIIRARQSPVIFMSANTINRQSPWFDEFAIRKQVEGVPMGGHLEMETDLGTHIYFEILPPDESEERQIVNRRFWGFNNPRLNAISGRGEWATETYQHIPRARTDEERGDTCTERDGRLFLQHQGALLRLRLVDHSRYGLCIFVTPATKLHDDSIIYTAGDILDRRYIFGDARGTALELPWLLYKRGRFWYSSNEVGCIVSSYVLAVQQRRLRMRI